MDFKAGDYYADLRKRKERPGSSWYYILVLPYAARRPVSYFDPEAEMSSEPRWKAIYGPGKLAGHLTSIPERRLRKLTYMGNATKAFKFDIPEEG